MASFAARIGKTMTPKVCRGFSTNHHSAIVKAAKLAGITKTEDVVAFSLGYQDALMQQETESSKAASAAKSPTSSTSFRISETDSPVIAQMQDILKNAKGCLSLAQGAVYWSPPAETIAEAATLVAKSPKLCSSYGPDPGIPELRAALRKKVEQENKLSGVEVMVTAGANQAFVNIVLTFLDSTDKCVLFQPYYFNHLMALQMTGDGSTNVVRGNVDSDWVPDADWLRTAVTNDKGIKMVVVVNPSNPTGVVTPRARLEEISAICKAANVMLVLDNTYEYFLYDDATHTALSGDHIINVFSFSKAYGLAGWRIGYFTFAPQYEAELMKVQDTVTICPSILSQHVALHCLEHGRPWVQKMLSTLLPTKQKIQDVLEKHLGADAVIGGAGAIYLLCKLPSHLSDDVAFVKRMAEEFGVAVIPGSAAGAPGYFRVSYAPNRPEDCPVIIDRLDRGLTHLCGGDASATD